MKKKIKVLISACLLGDNVKYSGGNNLTPELVTLLEKYNVDIIKVCPECFGGLPIPRVPSEIKENKVFSKDNRDVTEEFLAGAEKTLKAAKENEIDFVIVNSNEIEYYQVALTVLDENTLKRELDAFKNIKDNYPKHLITLDDVMVNTDYDGIKVVNALEWLLEEYLVR